jgi:outer membrane biosynthesis protein TonB
MADKQENEPAEPAVAALTQAEVSSLPQEINEAVETRPKPAKKKSKWRPRRKKKKAEAKSVEPVSRPPADQSDTVTYKRIEQAQDSAVKPPVPSSGTGGEGQDLLSRLRKVFEQMDE